MAHSNELNFTDSITVEAWVSATESRAEAMQEIVSKWTPLARFDSCRGV